nr:hypothetical protein [Candidatus Sigynarchaeota archaeon]
MLSITILELLHAAMKPLTTAAISRVLGVDQYSIKRILSILRHRNAVDCVCIHRELIWWSIPGTRTLAVSMEKWPGVDARSEGE